MKIRFVRDIAEFSASGQALARQAEYPANSALKCGVTDRPDTGFAGLGARFAIIERDPVQTSCKPAKIAIVAITSFNFRAGTRFANTQPISTPGTPPDKSCVRTWPLIEPNFHWIALPITASTSPNKISVPTTSGGVSSE